MYEKESIESDIVVLSTCCRLIIGMNKDYTQLRVTCSSVGVLLKHIYIRHTRRYIGRITTKY